MTPAERFPIDDIARAVGAELSDASKASLATWLETLAAWNARIDLTAAKTDADLAELMLTDALVLATRVPSGARVVDVGTGAGAPGLGLALARPDLEVTLVEPLGKRVSFLRTVIGTVKRDGVVVVSEKGDATVRRGARFDVATSRATLEPNAWVELGAQLIRDGGSVWALITGSEALPAQLAKLDRCESVTYTTPLTRRSRVAERFANVGR